MLKKIFLAASLFLSVNAFAQECVVEGIVLDSKTGEVMPFVNIALTGGKTGTISDINGEFKLIVPENMTGKDLSFSSVGYSPLTFKVSELSGGHKEIKMEPHDLKISEVVITDKSAAGRKVLKNVLENFSKNYVSCDFAYAGEYKSTVTKNGKTRNSVYSFNAYDSEGYVSKESSHAFESLNYKFQSTKRDFKVNDFETGINYFDLTSSFDIMRYELNVMNAYNLEDFDFTIKSETPENYVIAFTCLNPKVINTGALCPEKYYGEISVRKDKNVVTTADYTLEVKNFSESALSLSDKNLKNNAVIKCKVSYAEKNGKFSLSSVSADIDVKDSVKGNYTISDKITVESVNYKVPGKISGKVFYSR
ncbi:MAG: carboxypeptidase-like regulatory domain-containing protein [Bacteroidales bacterium]|nr:carboxypeptidase-like regulatory domain-containing protein [Bacteroidales bacterium]